MKACRVGVNPGLVEGSILKQMGKENHRKSADQVHSC